MAGRINKFEKKMNDNILIGEEVLYLTLKGETIKVYIHKKAGPHYVLVSYNHPTVGHVIFPAAFFRLKKIQLEFDF
jgi:hypothetical protein